MAPGLARKNKKPLKRGFLLMFSGGP